MKAVLYARVSSEKQAEKDLSISAQLKALRKYAADKGYEVVRDFVDEAESARTANRPAFQEMIALAKQKQKSFDAILVWKLSRFARDRHDSIIYKSLLRKYGISVTSITEQIDDSPTGKLLEGMIEVIDEFYSTNLAQDTLRGMKENAGRGYHCGSRVPLGYKPKKVMDGSNKRTKLEPDELFAPIVKRIFQMCIDGMGGKEIAKTLNREGLKTGKGELWRSGYVNRILQNEVYTGTLVWNRQGRSQGGSRRKDPEEVIRVESNHPSLIDREVFSKVQGILRSRAPKVTHPRTVGSRYLLSGLICCGKCGSAMTGCSANSSRYSYYSCNNYRTRGKDVCDNRLINKDKLEAFVIDRLKANILTEKNLTELVMLTNEESAQAEDRHEENLAIVNEQLEKSRERLDKLYTALETGKLEVEDLAPRIKELKIRIEDLEKERLDLLERMRNAEVELLDASSVKAYVDDLRDLLGKGSLIEQKSFLRSFIKRIEVNPPQVTIDYTIPLEAKKTEPLTREVLPFESCGHPHRGRDRPFADDRISGGALKISPTTFDVIFPNGFAPVFLHKFLRQHNHPRASPGGSIELANLLQNVPGPAPSGIYKYVAFIGDYDTSVMDSAYLAFEKEE